MKKIAVKMLMLVMALAMCQTTMADSKEKTSNGKGKPNTEHRGFGFGQSKKGERPQWGAQRPGQRKGFDQAKWDSLRAAHKPDAEKMKAHRDAMKAKMDSLKAVHQAKMEAHREAMKQKMDSLRAAHPEIAAKMDSLKAAHPNFGHKMDSLKHHGPKFGHGPMRGHGPMMGHRHFGRPMFAYRSFGFHRPNGEQTTEPEAQAKVMDATAVTKVAESQNAPTFDLQGRKVQGQQRQGIVIRNGKKYVK